MTVKHFMKETIAFGSEIYWVLASLAMWMIFLSPILIFVILTIAFGTGKIE